MSNNYRRIINQNLGALYQMDLVARKTAMEAELEGESFLFPAFGGHCRIDANGITLDGQLQAGPMGIILSLYALNAVSEPVRLHPFKAYKEFPNSMPYIGAFTTHTEQILVSHADRIATSQNRIMATLEGEPAPSEISGDTVFLVRPLPKIVLCYILYAADEDFPASVTCLFANNADKFMPMDGLADVGEYTSRRIIEIVQ